MTVQQMYDFIKTYIDKKISATNDVLSNMLSDNKVKEVGSNIDDVKSVADNLTDINTTAGSITNVNTVATDIDNVNNVANNKDNVDTVANNITNITNVGADLVNIDSVANSIDNINNVANNKNNIDTIANNITNVNTVGTNIDNVNSVANDLTNVVKVANDIDNIDTVATNITNVNTISTNIDNVNITADSIDDVNTYAKTYLGAKTEDPTERNDGSSLQVGDLYFNTTTNKMKVYNGTTWQLASSSVNGMVKKQTWTGDGTTTSFNVTDGYDTNYAEVYVNGVNVTQDVDLSDGQNIVFNTAPADGDEILGVFFGSFVLADCYTKTEADNTFVNKGDYKDIDVLNKIKNVDGAGSGLDADLVQGVPKDLLGIGGDGYQWVDETDNRNLDTVYTNTYGKPIQVGITCKSSENNDVFTLTIDGLEFSSTTMTSYEYGSSHDFFFTIPDNSSYKLSYSGDNASYTWFELK